MPVCEGAISRDGLGSCVPHPAGTGIATQESGKGFDVWQMMAVLEEENRRLKELLRRKDDELAQRNSTIEMLTQTVSSQQQTINHLIYNNAKPDSDPATMPLQSNIDTAMERMGLYLGNNKQRNAFAQGLREMFCNRELRTDEGLLLVRSGCREKFLRLLFAAMRQQQMAALRRKDNTVALARLKDYLHRNLYSFKGETRTQVPASHFDRPLRRILAKMEDSLREVGHCY